FVSDARGRRLAIYSIDASGIGLRLVSGSTAQDIDPAWSPDGRVIAFSRDGAIVVAPVGKGSERTLTDPKNNDSSPAWKPIAKGRLDGVAAVGGSGNSSIAGAAMRGLPVGVPKLIVSTVASGDTRPYMGASDVTMTYSVVDIAGINQISAQILTNAAGAIAGM